MGRVYYNKLVRDLIKDKIEGQGSACEVRTITDDAEFQQELLKKIVEEATALSRVGSREEFLDEYADLMVVLDAITAHLELSEADIKTAIEANVERKGLYEQRQYLHWSEDDGYQSNESTQGVRS